MLGDPAAKYDPAGEWRHDDARVRRAPARTRRRLDLAERHDRQLRRRISLGRRSWLTCEETVAGPEATRRPSSSRSATATCTRCPSTAGRTSWSSASRSARPGGSRRGDGGRPAARDRLRDRGPGSFGRRVLSLHPGRPAAADRRRPPADTRGRGRPQLDMREDQEPGRPLLVEWVDIDEPTCRRRRSPTRGGRSSRATPRAARCSTDSRAAGRARDDLHRLHQWRRRQERRRERRRLRGGFGQIWMYRPRGDGGLLRLVYESPSARSWTGRTASRSRRAAAADVRGRRIVGVRRPPRWRPGSRTSTGSSG